MKIKGKVVIGLLLLLGFAISFKEQRVLAADNDRYLAYVGQSQDSFGMPIYVENIKTGKVDVAYCINESKKLPYSAIYNRFDATSERLMALDKPLVSRELLPGIIKRIIYNGYPLNATNLQGSLSDGAFRRLTQLAIWHYSDSFNVDESELTPQERWVYHQLIQGTNLVPVNLNLNIYVRDDSSYQDLLGTSFGKLPEHPQFSSSSMASSSTSSSSTSSSESSNSSSSITKAESSSSTPTVSSSSMASSSTSSSSSSSSESSNSSSSITKAESSSSTPTVSSSSMASSSTNSSSTSSSESSSSSSSITKAESSSSTPTVSSSSMASSSTSSSSTSSSESSSSSSLITKVESSSSTPTVSSGSTTSSSTSSNSSSSSESESSSSSSSVSTTNSSTENLVNHSEDMSSSGNKSSSVKLAKSDAKQVVTQKSLPTNSQVISKPRQDRKSAQKQVKLPQTGESSEHFLWLSLAGCLLLMGALSLFERKYR
ncbi:Cys-Gln thioester bond-forming surface protein [Ligilactobacillus agilis]|uniref:Cys-Gln thioester bond-forming surface protein n=1 Tax=Ligilactobacillus agilis TaxID=1601 RepID=UPI00195CD75C|nr:Cys-Gln thioester bond-forming surface protein [Ligilactobacillus agilis]MBM6762712.1 TQXA domain-containing protein [Ligilactobacillus agilis]